jgi:hypothetical protein
MVYSLQKINKFTGISVDVLRWRCVQLGIEKQKENSNRYILTQKQMISVLDFENVAIPEFIVCHTNWITLESKMNHEK